MVVSWARRPVGVTRGREGKGLSNHTHQSGRLAHETRYMGLSVN